MSRAAKICVAVRKRPVGPDDKDVVACSGSNLTVNEPRIKFDLTPYTERHQFAFDEVFDEGSKNRDLYVRAALPLIDTVFEKGSASCFVYGQTGSGKSHSMLGKQGDPGIYVYSAQEIFTRAQKLGCITLSSFYEIYGRKIFDLLNDRAKLVCREDGNSVIQICGLTEHPVSSIEELVKLIETGSAARAAGQTSANSESSRSHAVLTLEVRDMKDQRPVGKMSFIDLAGNERGSDTANNDRKTRIEGAEINKSLLALKECIRALGMGKSHVPFRGSILTEVLRDSFIGNSRTAMIACISPLATNCENTLNTLRYTARVKELGPGGKAPKGGKDDGVTNPALRYKVQRDETGNNNNNGGGGGGGGVGKAQQNNNNINNKGKNNNNNNVDNNNNNDAKFEAKAAYIAGILAQENAAAAAAHNNNNNNNNGGGLPPISSSNQQQQQLNNNINKNAVNNSKPQEQPKLGRRAVSNPTTNNSANVSNAILGANSNNNGKRPAWNNEFVEEKIADHNNKQPGNMNKPGAVGGNNNNNKNNNVNNNKRPVGSNNNNQLKDPIIQTIIQNHINQLDEIEAAAEEEDDDEDDDDDDMNNNNDDDDDDVGAAAAAVNKKKNNFNGSLRKARAVHAHIVSRIRQSEESMIAVHRRHIDSKMQMMKGEVAQLQGLDENSSIDEYVEKVDALLAKQMKEIQDMRDRLAKIGTYLKEEEVLSKTLTPAGKRH